MEWLMFVDMPLIIIDGPRLMVVRDGRILIVCLILSEQRAWT